MARADQPADPEEGNGVKSCKLIPLMIHSIAQAGFALVIGSLLAHQPQPASAIAVTAYNTIDSGSLSGTSSTELTTTWGDRVLLAATGKLNRFEFTLFNSPSSVGNLNAINILLRFFDGPSFNTSTGTGSLLGFVDGDVIFSSGLTPGTYSRIAVDGNLLSTPIDLTTNDVFITQTILAKAGPASRLGIITSSEAPLVGSNYDGFFFRSNSSGTGLYQLSGTTTNVLYFLSVTPAPSPLPIFGAVAAFRWSRRLRKAERHRPLSQG